MKVIKSLNFSFRNLIFLFFLIPFLSGSHILFRDSAIAESVTKKFNPNHYEIRWFFKGIVPKNVKNWFQTEPSFGEYIEKEKRSDVYLITKATGNISPKIRGGRFEIKYLNSQDSFSICDGKISGIAENWSKDKWEFSKHLEGDVLAAFMVADLGGSRAEISKKRLQRKFELTEEGKLIPVPMKNRPQMVCLIELTDLKVKDEPWWTVAYEIISDSELPLKFSQEKLCELFRNYPGPKLITENSYSYPKWLSAYQPF